MAEKKVGGFPGAAAHLKRLVSGPLSGYICFPTMHASVEAFLHVALHIHYRALPVCRLRHRELSSLELRELDYKVADGQDRKVERTLEASHPMELELVLNKLCGYTH